MGIGVDTQTLIEQHLAIGALASTDKENEVVFGGKLRDVRHAVGYRATDSIEALEGGIRGDMILDIFDDAMELVERFGGLTVEVDVARKIELLDIIEMFDNNGMVGCLAHQTKYLSMTLLAKDDDLGS